ncbi:hypothetical protein ZWY2020_053652 [Hordeum vulgare]|nr:hypothetical protein ZWY2020_053652 [Hordeum vulgare]
MAASTLLVVLLLAAALHARPLHAAGAPAEAPPDGDAEANTGSQRPPPLLARGGRARLLRSSGAGPSGCTYSGRPGGGCPGEPTRDRAVAVGACAGAAPSICSTSKLLLLLLLVLAAGAARGAAAARTGPAAAGARLLAAHTGHLRRL